MVHNDNLPCSQQLLGDNDASQGIGDAASGVADNVSVAFLKTEGPSRVLVM